MAEGIGFPKWFEQGYGAGVDMRDFDRSEIVLCARWGGWVDNTALHIDEASRLVAIEPDVNLFVGNPIRVADQFEEIRQMGPKLSRIQVAFRNHLEQHLDDGVNYCYCGFTF